MTNGNKSHSEFTLEEWLFYLENIHSVEIDMGLGRIAEVASRLSVDLSFAKVITVAGTNGKGTTCAFLENALLAKKHTVAVYSSPHIHSFNERLRVNKNDIDNNALIKAFNRIEIARGSVSLTYYEFTTLAAFLVLMEVAPQYIILEVGLGGRLDATNVIDADLAVITTVDLDHQAFLGNDRESIGREKAGIMRTSQKVVIGDKKPPQSVLDYAEGLEVLLYLREREFSVECNDKNLGWHVRIGKNIYQNLPEASIPIDNIATALQVLDALDITLDTDTVCQLVSNTKVAGRTELIKDSSLVMLDVGHNPLASRYLSSKLAHLKADKVHAVVGMLADKDIENTLTPLLSSVDYWYATSLNVSRGAPASMLAETLENNDANVLSFDNVSDGYKMAKSKAGIEDLILVFGSFFTVAQAKKIIN